MYRLTLSIILLLLSTSYILSQNPMSIPLPPSGQYCWDSVISQTSDTSFEEFITELDQGSGIYTNVAPTKDLTQLGRSTFETPIGEQIHIQIQKYSQYDDPYPIRYIVLLNGLQIDAFVNNGDLHNYEEIILEPETYYSTSVVIPPLEAGIHTVDIIDISLTKPEFSLQHPLFSGYRLTFIAGEPEIDEMLPDYEMLPTDGSIENNDPNYILYLSPGDFPTAWDDLTSVYRVTEDRDLSFDILAGYLGASIPEGSGLEPIPSSQFALMVFIDGQQYPINTNSTLLYGEVTRDTAYARVPVNISLENLSMGSHELVVARIDNPNIPRCLLRDTPMGYILNDGVTYVRVMFVVTDTQ